MKKLFLSLIIFAGVSLTAFSQRTDGCRNMAPMMAKELNLTEEQQQKMKSVDESFGSKMQALRSDKSLSKDAKREKMREMAASKRTEMQALLTPEQQAKMNEVCEKRKDMPRRGQGQFAERPRKKANDLNLNDEQTSQMRSINESFRKQMQDLRADTSLDKDACNAKRKELATAHKEKLNSILTPEQQSKMKDRFDRGRKDFGKNGKFQGRKGRGDNRRFDAQTTSELKSLKENFIKEKKAVELSRIAPEAQKERVRELKEKYRNERRTIVEKAMEKNKS